MAWIQPDSLNNKILTLLITDRDEEDIDDLGMMVHNGTDVIRATKTVAVLGDSGGGGGVVSRK